MSLLWKKSKDLFFSQMKLQNIGYIKKNCVFSIRERILNLLMSLILIIPNIMPVI